MVIIKCDGCGAIKPCGVDVSDFNEWGHYGCGEDIFDAEIDLCSICAGKVSKFIEKLKKENKEANPK